jgi:hypothetical protein
LVIVQVPGYMCRIQGVRQLRSDTGDHSCGGTDRPVSRLDWRSIEI